MSYRHVPQSCFRLLLTISMLAAGWPSLVAQELPPVPLEAAQQEAVKLVEEVFGEELEKASTSSARKALASKMLKTAEDSSDLTNRYVLLRMARDVATQAGEGRTAMQAVEEIGKSFQVDLFKIRKAALIDASKSASRASQRKSIAKLAIGLIDECVELDDFAAAENLGRVAINAARKAKDKELAKQIVGKNKTVAEMMEAHAAAKVALQTLEKSPADQDANLAAGSYLCFVKGDWEKGIPLLALGGNDQAAKLAIKELEGIDDLPGQVAMGDDWWALSESKDGLAKEQVRRRAAAWYRTVEKRVGNLVKLKIQKRLREIKDPASPMVLLTQPKNAVADSGSAKQPKLTVAEVHRIDDLTSVVLSLDFSPDNRILAATGLGKTVFLIDTKTYKIVQKLEGHTEDARCVVYSPDGREIATGARDQTVKLWDADTGQLKDTFRGHSGGLMDVTFSPNGRALASVAMDNSIRLWDLDDPSKHSVLKGHSGWISAVRFSPDGNRLATAGGSDKTVRIWDVETRKMQHVLKGHTGKVRRVRFLSDGQTLLSSSDDKTIRIWDTKAGKQLHKINSPSPAFSMEVLRPNQQVLVSGGSDKLIRFWDIKTRKMITSAEDLPKQTRWAMASSSDGRLLAVGGKDKKLRIYSINAQK